MLYDGRCMLGLIDEPSGYGRSHGQDYYKDDIAYTPGMLDHLDYIGKAYDAAQNGGCLKQSLVGQ